MNEATGALRDIRGLDAVPWWPLAPGWWVLAALAAVAVTILVVLWRRRRRRRLWRIESARLLRDLRRRLAVDDPRVLAGELSQLLRRIAMTRHGRRECAGLSGVAWLAWLETHDPRGFPWRALGKPLIDLPYAPQSADVGATALAPLVSAARAWIVSEPWTPPPRRPLPAAARPRRQEAVGEHDV